jgi:hypothetical protein
MRHQNTVFHALLKYVPWGRFEALVERYGADRGVRELSTKDQLVALLYGQFAGASSLREIVTALESHEAQLYHLGARGVRRSTLADANASRPSAVFAGLLSQMIAGAHRGLRKRLEETVYLIDSTCVRLTSASASWARFTAKVKGAKVHVIYDPDAHIPIYAAVTPGNVNDITSAQEMPIEPGATYVFDLGFYDYAWWAKLAEAGCRIVTRFKKNTPLTLVQDLKLPDDTAILSDRIGRLPARQAASRRNPFADPVREIRVKTDTGKELRLLTNDLDAPAQEIADLYKRRWQIELFFRWVKQTLKITRFIGTNENAVKIQVAVALIAFLILRLAHAATKLTSSPLAFARLVRSNLMHRRTLDRLLETRTPSPNGPLQFQLKWCEQ